MELKNLYQLTIYYNQNYKGDSEEKKIYCDSDNIYELADLPNDTVFIWCQKYDKKEDKYKTTKNYVIGKVIDYKELKNSPPELNPNTKGFVDYIISQYDNLKDKFCLFINGDKLCVFNTADAECEVLRENQLADGRVVEKNISDYFDKAYIDLE